MAHACVDAAYETGALPVKDFNYAVEYFNLDKQVFDQNSYENAVNVQADMLVTLEAMREAFKNTLLEMATVETYVYGNSLDTYDNGNDADSTELDVN